VSLHNPLVADTSIAQPCAFLSCCSFSSTSPLGLRHSRLVHRSEFRFKHPKLHKYPPLDPSPRTHRPVTFPRAQRATILCLEVPARLLHHDHGVPAGRSRHRGGGARDSTRKLLASNIAVPPAGQAPRIGPGRPRLAVLTQPGSERRANTPAGAGRSATGHEHRRLRQAGPRHVG